MKLMCFPLLLFLPLLVRGQERSFTIGSNTFLKDGKAFRYVSGSLHYFRIPREYWEDRLRKVRAAGLNAIQVYVEWSYHQPQYNEYRFEEQYDIVKFIEMAQENDLLVLLRPGPFIDAERDMGGFPFWLLNKNPAMKLRSSDPQYLHYVDEWFSVLLPRLRPLLYRNGGPIIMVQSENEYGSYTSKPDTDYLIHMRDLLQKYLVDDVIIYSTDGCSIEDVRNGRTPMVYSSVDFGPNSDPDVCFHYQDLFEPSGPKINSEYYPGWLDHWGQPHNTHDSASVASTLDEMLFKGANVNIYMMHGGTSFGFSAGANSPPFMPNPTSYDYDAPISEGGDLTEKYFAIKNVIKKYLDIPDISVNATDEKGDYGSVRLSPMALLFDQDFEGVHRRSRNPLSFEALGQSHGLVMYETKIKGRFTDPALLKVKGIRDRGYVYINGLFKGILSRMSDISSIPISVNPGDKLQIIVENQGRSCYGNDINQVKGIASHVVLQNKKGSKKVLRNWTMTGYPLEDLKSIDINEVKKRSWRLKSFRLHLVQNKGSMSFWKGTFKTPCNETKAKDTFLETPGWRKGVAYINGINLGRYWPVMGPQQTLYVPGAWIKPECQENTLVMFEQDGAPFRNPMVKLIKNPILDGPTPFKT